MSSAREKPVRRPWYPRYVDDYNTDDKVQDMSWAERGFYDFLLDMQWKHGSIPADRRRLARWARMTVDQFEVTFGPMVDLCFASVPGDDSQLRNPKQERVRAEQETFSALQRERANNRWQSGIAPASTRHTPGNAGPMPDECRVDASEISNVKDKLRTEETFAAAPRVSFDFASVYDAYPRKEGRAKGIERLRSQVRSPEAFEQLQRAVRHFAEKVSVEGTEMRFVPHFSSWANGKWRDYIDGPHVADSRRGFAEPRKPVPEGHEEEL